MADTDDVSSNFSNVSLNDNSHPLINSSQIDECEEAVTTDSEEYLSEPLSRYQNYLHSTSSSMSTATLESHIVNSDNYVTCNEDYNLNNLQIPIVGYEVMEERARFTVYKLRISNKASGDCWYVFRRYTDFVRLSNRLKHKYPNVAQHLPRKRWLRNNFDPVFLEERVSGLQTFVNALLGETELVHSQLIQDFFCLNEPPVYSESNEESRAIFEALEDTIYQLKQQLREKDTLVDNLQDKLHSLSIENDNLRKVMKKNCQKCQKDYENLSKMLNE